VRKLIAINPRLLYCLGMSRTISHIFDHIFRNKKGTVVIWQFPNAPLWGWIVASVAAMIIKHGREHAGLHLLAQAFLFAWAYLELRSGESIFRKVLGGLLLIVIAISFFKP
jgi:hypothetical protein